MQALRIELQETQILAAARTDRALFDAALRPLVAIGTPTVQPLVAAGEGREASQARATVRAIRAR